MKWKTLMAGLLVQAWLVGTAGAADHIGQVISVEGAVKVQGTDGQMETLVLNSQVHLNDRIVTEAGARVQIMLADEALIMVGESSEMTLDEYVYSPQVAAENETSIGLVRGVFRVITAKITDLNPKKFHVKSKLATIGIRGCELGFEVGMDREDIHIIRVPEEKEIMVTSHAGQGQELRLFQQGILISVNAKRLTDRPLTAEDIRRITKATTPSQQSIRAAADAGAGDPTQDPAVARIAALREGMAGNEVALGLDLADSDVAVDENGATLSSLWQARLGVDELVDATTSGGGMIEPVAEVAVVEQALASSPALERVSPMDTTVETVVETVVEATPPPVGAGEPPSGLEDLLAVIIDILTGDPEPTYPIIGDRITTPRGGGLDWSWGTWEQTDLLSATETRTLYGAEITGNVLSPAEFLAVSGVGSPFQTLRGTGSAGAGVTQGDQGALLLGSSDITLQVGAGVASTWSGTFDLGNASGDRLLFNATSTLRPADGALVTGASGYSLNAFGSGYNQASLTRNEVNGSLVGSGGLITGNTGTFDFEHGAAGPAVQGVFGSELAP